MPQYRIAIELTVTADSRSAALDAVLQSVTAKSTSPPAPVVWDFADEYGIKETPHA